MPSSPSTAHGMRVFPSPDDTTSQGGNPTVIFLNAASLSDEQMQVLTQASHHECGFVTDDPKLQPDGMYHVSIRYWVPEHEMEMCGHATIGALWLLRQEGRLPGGSRVAVHTLAGVFEGLIPSHAGEGGVKLAQPKGEALALTRSQEEAVAEALGITIDDLDGGIQNARTARFKTLVPLKNVAALDALEVEQVKVRKVCEDIGSTGLYPYARAEGSRCTFSARQFPKSSGYLEDPATGIAATALVCGLTINRQVNRSTTEVFKIRQGWAMGMPSEIQIEVTTGTKEDGFWMTGQVEEMGVAEGVLALLR